MTSITDYYLLVLLTDISANADICISDMPYQYVCISADMPKRPSGHSLVAVQCTRCTVNRVYIVLSRCFRNGHLQQPARLAARICEIFC